MHTYLKDGDVYRIGMWLKNREGFTSFNKMFDVDEFGEAIAAVNILNGGTGLWNDAAFYPQKEY